MAPHPVGPYRRIGPWPDTGAMDRIEHLEDLLPTAELDPLRDEGQRAPSVRASAARTLPGLGAVGACVAVAFAISHLIPSLSALVVAVVIGAVLANGGAVPAWSRDGADFAAKRLLRFGVVLLGFQLAIAEVLHLGGPTLIVVAATVGATFFGTQWLGRRMGVSPGLSLLIATGFSICGASVVAAMEGVADTDEEEVPLSGAVPLKALQDKPLCVVDMSTERHELVLHPEKAAWNTGLGIGYIGESLQITCPRRSSRPSSATSRTPSRRLQISGSSRLSGEKTQRRRSRPS